MMEMNLTTPELATKATKYLESLGFTEITSCERWEGDGVQIVSPPPGSPDRHWYLELIGNDSDEFPAGIDLVLINDESSDDVVSLETLQDLPELLKKNGYLA